MENHSKYLAPPERVKTPVSPSQQSGVYSNDFAEVRSKKPINLSEPQGYSSNNIYNSGRKSQFSRVTSVVDKEQIHNDENADDFTKRSFTSRTKDLVYMIFEQPFIEIPKLLSDTLEIPQDCINLATLLKVVQIMCQVAVIGMASQSISNDKKQVSSSVWAFLIAEASIVLAISVLFAFRLFRMHRIGAVMYSFIGFSLCISAFGVVLSKLAQGYCTNTSTYCQLRQGIIAMVSLSTFVWVIELSIYLTIVYVASRGFDPNPNDGLDHINDPEAYLEHQSMRTVTPHTPMPMPPMSPAATVLASEHQKEIEQDLAEPEVPKVETKRFVVTEEGLFPVTNGNCLDGKVKAEIYADV